MRSAPRRVARIRAFVDAAAMATPDGDRVGATWIRLKLSPRVAEISDR
jgi:hypothetical protein